MCDAELLRKELVCASSLSQLPSLALCSLLTLFLSSSSPPSPFSLPSLPDFPTHTFPMQKSSKGWSSFKDPDFIQMIPV